MKLKIFCLFLYIQFIYSIDHQSMPLDIICNICEFLPGDNLFLNQMARQIRLDNTCYNNIIYEYVCKNRSIYMTEEEINILIDKFPSIVKKFGRVLLLMAFKNSLDLCPEIKYRYYLKDNNIDQLDQDYQELLKDTLDNYLPFAYLRYLKSLTLIEEYVDDIRLFILGLNNGIKRLKNIPFLSKKEKSKLARDEELKLIIEDEKLFKQKLNFMIFMINKIRILKLCIKEHNNTHSNFIKIIKQILCIHNNANEVNINEFEVMVSNTLSLKKSAVRFFKMMYESLYVNERIY